MVLPPFWRFTEVLCNGGPKCAILVVLRGKSFSRKRRHRAMHDLLLALTFISMIVAPAIVAAKSGKKEFDPETESLSAAERQMASFSPAPLKRERMA